MNPRDILLVYDKECPVCDVYCRMVRLRGSSGTLRLVNARDASAVMHEITAQGLDIDQGMVLKAGDVLHYGSDAIHELALISSPSGVLSRLNCWMFRSRSLSRILYPVLRFFRNLLLKALHKTKINNLRLGNNKGF